MPRLIFIQLIDGEIVMNKVSLFPLLSILSAFSVFAFIFPALAEETGSPDSFEPVPFTTIEQGQAGRFGEGDADGQPVFGGQPVFKDPETWKSFWEAYTEGRDPRPESPNIDFNQDMIIVSSLGEVSDVYVDRNQGIIRVTAGDMERSDFSSETTTPFHIIKTEKLEFRSIIFEHQKPTKGPVTGEETPNGADFNATTTPDAQTQDFSAAYATVPSCVELRQWEEWTFWEGWSSWAEATNRCGYGVRFRMIWAWAYDGQCMTVHNYWLEGRHGRFPYVSELRPC
jgi:hypothetical protein